MMGRETAGLFFSRTYDFLERYLPRQAGRSPETVRAYRDALTVFRRYARDVLGKGVGDLAFGDVDRDCVLGWLERMGEEGLSAATRNQRLAAIRSYLWYAADCDVRGALGLEDTTREGAAEGQGMPVRGGLAGNSGGAGRINPHGGARRGAHERAVRHRDPSLGAHGADCG